MSEGVSRRRILLLALAVTASAPAALAFVAIVGAGTLRRGGPLAVAATAAVLVGLPPLAPAGYVRKATRTALVLGALAAWSLVLLAVFPVYFPNERADAVATGVAVTFLPEPLAAGLLALERVVPSGGQNAQPPPPMAQAIVESISAGAQAELETAPSGSTLTVAARVRSRSGQEAALRMVFDTGASLTTLPRHVLDGLGIHVEDDAPEVALGTASGEIKAKLVLVESITLGNLVVPWVTVAVCDACAQKGFDGLLGLNVSGQFLVTIDGARNRIQLERRAGLPNRVLDIAPWVTLRANATTWLDGRVEVEVHVWNSSGRTLGAVEAAVRCDRTFLVELRGVAPNQTHSAAVRLPRGAQCGDSYTARLERAAW